MASLKFDRKILCLLFIVYMQLLFFLALSLNLWFPADLLNVRRQKFFGRSTEKTTKWQNSTGTTCPPRLLSTPPVFKGPTNDRQKAIVRAFQHAWDGYKKHAWGHDELKPLSSKWDDPFELGLTIVDGLDTALIMGLEKESQEAIEWIRHSLNVTPSRSVNVFETTIRVLGGLLSGYHFTGEQVLLEKAVNLADRLMFAFKSKSPIPKSDVDLSTGNAFSPNQDLSSLAEATSLQLEFRDLSFLTGNQTYEDVSFAASEHIHRIGCKQFDGLCPYYINGVGEFRKTSITLGARADSYYEYLIKQWLQTKKSVDWLKTDFLESINGIKKHLYRKSVPNGLWFVGEIKENLDFYPKMDHLACFLSGSLVLSHLNQLDTTGEHLKMAENLGEICHKMYENPTGLGPEIIHVNMEDGGGDTSREDIYVKNLDSHSLLRPEAIEAWFYLFRVTNDKKYQEWGWKAFEAIEKYAKLESGGYTSIDNVLRTKIKRRDKMESFFLAETLKYLYLLLSDDQTILPFDQWIYNTEAHPLPIYS